MAELDRALGIVTVWDLAHSAGALPVDLAGTGADFAAGCTYKYINYVTDRRNNRTDFTNDPITGNVTQVKYALTPEDTTGQGNTRPTVNYTYTNSYYLHTIQDEAKPLLVYREPAKFSA